MISCRDISVHYDSTGMPDAALCGVSLDIAQGEVVGLLGPNGSGKTTLLNAIAGLIPLKTGSITIDNDSISALSHKERALRLACVPQRPESIPDMAVFLLVLMGRYPYLPFWGRYSEQDMDIARAAMDETSITHLAERSARTLSGGELQRVLVARAFAQSTGNHRETLLLDEATTGLDAAHITMLFDHVLRRNRRRRTRVIAAVHELNLAALYCSRLIFLKQGRVIADGPTCDVFTTGLLEEVYETRFHLIPHPVTGQPQALFVPGAH